MNVGKYSQNISVQIITMCNYYDIYIYYIIHESYGLVYASISLWVV